MNYRSAIPVIETSDVPGTLKYYIEVLGFAEHFAYGEPMVYAGVQRNGVQIYITRNEGLAAKTLEIHPEIFLWVDEVDSVFAAHKSRGAKIVEEISDRPWDARQYVIEDPNGYHIKVAEPIDAIRQPTDSTRPSVGKTLEKYRLYQVDSFTTELFRGNPAGVVPNADGLTDAQMQAIAREMNCSETAFVLSPTANDHEVWERFFTPKTEVPTCGHATVAAHYVRALELDLPSCRVVQKIGAGILPVEIIREGDNYRIVMTQGAIEFENVFVGQQRDEIVAALGLNKDDLDERCPVQIVSTGHSKVMIGIRERTVLNQLRPDMSRLTQISGKIKCNGFFVFVLATDSAEVLSHGRMFAPAIGIVEDPVTGNANGPLGAYLVRHKLAPNDGRLFQFKGQQGEAIGRLGIVDVSVEIADGNPKLVQIGGRAVVVFKTELAL